MRLAVIFGGKSPEHEVACKSAFTILSWLESSEYDIVKIGISKEGKWILTDASLNDIKGIKWEESQGNKEVYLNPNPDNKEIITEGGERIKLDCAFPVLHGVHGEDGDVQGIFELMELPYVGPNVRSSACCMDKSFTKQMAEKTGIKMAKHVLVQKEDFERDKEKVISDYEDKYPVFVKPCSTGSSVGVSKASNPLELKASLTESFKYDSKAFIEEMIVGREIEVAVLGNENPKATAPGEIIAAGEFYDYDSKYNNPDSKAELAEGLSKEKIEEFKEAAVKLYKALDCKGMARVDFFLKEDGEIVFNEINTIPGFTDISMYPKLWEYEGIKGPKLIDELIRLAMER